jgi:acyl-CoA synthetase (NDP forming)
MTTFDSMVSHSSSATGRSWKQIASPDRYAELLRQQADHATQDQPPRMTSESIARQARMLVRAAGGRVLTERESKAILALYGIRTTREILAPSFERAVEAAQKIGYPVAVKAESTALVHKSDAGAVMLDIADEVALKRGFKRTLAAAWATVPWDSINGILVQEMITPGIEVLVGMTNEPQYGPVVACRLKGDAKDTPEDVQWLLPPFSEGEARATLGRLYGATPADLDALVGMLLRFAELCLDLRDIVDEIDVSPLIVAESGGGACAVDCSIVPAL